MGPYYLYEQQGPEIEAIDEVIAIIVAEQEEEERLQSTESEKEKAQETDAVESDDLKTETSTPQPSLGPDPSRKRHKGPSFDGPQPKVVDLDKFRTETIKM